MRLNVIVDGSGRLNDGGFTVVNADTGEKVEKVTRVELVKEMGEVVKARIDFLILPAERKA